MRICTDLHQKHFGGQLFCHELEFHKDLIFHCGDTMSGLFLATTVVRGHATAHNGGHPFTQSEFPVVVGGCLHGNLVIGVGLGQAEQK